MDKHMDMDKTLTLLEIFEKALAHGSGLPNIRDTTLKQLQQIDAELAPAPAPKPAPPTPPTTPMGKLTDPTAAKPESAYKPPETAHKPDDVTRRF